MANNSIIKKNVLFLLLFIFIGCSKIPNSEINDQKKLEIKKWDSFFDSAGLDGTFVLTKLNSDTMAVYNLNRAGESFLPASTFKILNSLISLEEKVILDENEIIKWDEKKRFYDKWNQDHNLKSAIRISCVWFYQELARRVGKERMQYYLDKTSYGNAKIGADVDKFWLEGDLKIS